MSFFRRPGDSSSDSESSSSSTSEDIAERSFHDSNGTLELSDHGSNGEADTDELVLTRTISNGDYGGSTNREQLRDLALTSMLEELSRYKAAELMNKSGACTDANVLTKDSPEVQDFARTLLERSSRVLENGNLLPSDSIRRTTNLHRHTFISELERLSQQNVVTEAQLQPPDNTHVALEPPANAMALVPHMPAQPAPFQNTFAAQWGQLNYEQLNGWNSLRRPSADLPISALMPSMAFASRYLSNFEQQHMLGRGGFGRVYQALNILDKQTYAIKQIPLSPRLASKYMQHGHSALEPILREVQALAKLDHPNVIRYHASWLETPPLNQTPNASVRKSSQGRLLLDDKPATQSASPASGVDKQTLPTFHRVSSAKGIVAPEYEDFDPFNRSEAAENESGRALVWSVQNTRKLSIVNELDNRSMLSAEDSLSADASSIQDIAGPYLCVQTTMYPMTLDHYLGRKVDNHESQMTPVARHCFHIVPALRIILGILCGLQYVHAQGLLHRDVKPGNIFMNIFESPLPALAVAQGYVDIGSCPSCPAAQQARFLNPRIGDFGLVSELVGRRENDQSDSNAAGTHFYRPPAHQGKAVLNEKFDVFSLGIILLELLFCCNTGSERFNLLKETRNGILASGQLQKKAREEGLSDGLAQDLEDCVRNMIHKDHHLRSSCEQVQMDISGLLGNICSVEPYLTS